MIRRSLIAIHLASLVGLVSVLGTPSISLQLRTWFVAGFSLAWLLTVAIIFAHSILLLMRASSSRRQNTKIIFGLLLLCLYILFSLIAILLLLMARA